MTLHDLIHKIRMAQVQAAEEIVIENLKALGLNKPSRPKRKVLPFINPNKKEEKLAEEGGSGELESSQELTLKDLKNLLEMEEEDEA